MNQLEKLKQEFDLRARMLEREDIWRWIALIKKFEARFEAAHFSGGAAHLGQTAPVLFTLLIIATKLE